MGPSEETGFSALLLSQHMTWSRVLALFLEWNGTAVGAVLMPVRMPPRRRAAVHE